MVEQKPRPLDFGILLGFAYQSFTELLREALVQQGFDDLGGAYGYVFRTLVDEEPSQRELARSLGITDQGMAKIISEMVKRGYVERHADPTDSRVNRLRLGPRGRAALAAARQFHATFEKRLKHKVGPDAVAQLRELLEHVAARASEPKQARTRLRPM
jgi:DNA-binding MarR family transcriptional regulator